MTTIIATKDSILSDGKVTVGARVDQLNFCKVRNIGNYLIGGAGRASSITKFFDWFATKVHAEDLQSMSDILVIDIPQDERDEEFTALIVTPDGRILIHEGNDVTRVLECGGDYYAIGSGSDYALAALDAGATPEAAMEVAKYRDCYSGGETFKVEFEEQAVIPETREEASELTREQLLDIVYGKAEAVEQEESVSTPEEDAMQELVQVSQEAGLYDSPTKDHPWAKNTGECPVDDDVLVDVMWHDGSVNENHTAGTWYWGLPEDEDTSGCILKWRLHNA